MNPVYIIPIVALIVASILSVTGLIIAYQVRKNQNARDEKGELQGRVDQLERDMAKVTTQVSPLWAVVQTTIAKQLTHPHPQFASMDALLVKLEALTITDEERAILQELLEERMTSDDPEVSESEKASARIMLGVMPKVVEEAAFAAAVHLKDKEKVLVALPTTPDNEETKE